MLQAYYKGTNVKVRTGEEIRTTSGQVMIFERATRKTEIGKSGKITTSNGMEYYAHIFNLEVKEHDEYEEKFIFVTDELIQVAQSINNRIEKLLFEYKSNSEEVVIIYYVTGASKVVNVTCDSLKAIAIDVLKEI